MRNGEPEQNIVERVKGWWDTNKLNVMSSLKVLRV